MKHLKQITSFKFRKYTITILGEEVSKVEAIALISGSSILVGIIVGVWYIALCCGYSI